MSYWYEPKKEDISFSEDKEEMHVYIDQDSGGSIYVSLKLDDVWQAIKGLQDKNP